MKLKRIISALLSAAVIASSLTYGSALALAASVTMKTSVSYDASSTLSAPKSLKTELSSATSVKLSWKKVTGADGYEISMTVDGKTSVIGKTKNLTFTKKKLTRGKAYRFKVRAYKTVNGKKSYGAYSDETVRAVWAKGLEDWEISELEKAVARGMISADTAASAQGAEDLPEIAKAKELGIFPTSWKGNLSSNASFDEFYGLLANFVALSGKRYSTAWKKQIDKTKFPKRALKRDDALCMLMLAAETLGYDKYNARNFGFCIENRVDYDLMFSQLSWDYPYFDNNKQISLYTDSGEQDDGEPVGNAPTAGIFWMQRCMDIYQRKHFLDCDEKLNFNLNKPLTRYAAVAAVIRLYNYAHEKWNPFFYIKGEKDDALLADEEKAKQAIINNTKSVSCKGTTYYISNSGNDANDGLTPKTAWKTLEKVNTAPLSKGDGVYFERGGLWRGQLWSQDGVTYSAYGKGDKPKIYASPENGADPSKWSLLKGTKNIWVYHIPMMDCGNIVFNEGEKSGIKVMPNYLNAYRSLSDPTKPFSVKKELSEDLSFFSKADSILYDGAPFRYYVMDMSDHNEREEVVGTLYLRCDAGNPGEIFDSIEFAVRQNIILPANNTIFNNLCLKYTGGSAIFGWFNDDEKGTKHGYSVSFCEMGWIGGSPQYYDYADGTPVQCGNGVECDGSYDYFTVTDCYIYQVFDAGVSNQYPEENADVLGEAQTDFPPSIMRNITYARNVFEYVDMPVEIFIARADENHLMKNVLIEDNWFMYTGYGVHTQQSGQYVFSSSYMGHAYPNRAENFVIRNNVFYLSTGPLLRTGAKREWLPKLSGNTYVQEEDGIFAVWINEKDELYVYYYYDAENVMKNILGDKTGTVWSE